MWNPFRKKTAVKQAETGVIIISPQGDVDIKQAADMKAILDDKIAEGNVQFVVNCEGVQFFDVSGIGVFLNEVHRLRSVGGDIKLCSLSPEVHELVTTVFGLSSILSISESENEAIPSFSGKTNGQAAPSQYLWIAESNEDGIPVLKLKGSVVTEADLDLFQGTVEKATGAGAKGLLIDCSDFLMVSKSSMGWLIALSDSLERKGVGFGFVGIGGVLGVLINAMGLAPFFTSYQSQREAIEALSK